ncbi:RNA polymerase sigma-70 factor [Mangrovibacterium marinum]|uniref:RNA polymerase sigma factor n=1 Tax=Mangrovibacterium marinum TaxID=1639118 RepID=A0A2T5BT73_9BACT|nr:RNA polymerase sigma-70 factor [Mangrovibacterium marinum]PTN02625.1 RNA polymerase sigma-70 factor (ECF subfamily) [Mangrovibacterium marinum]
MKRKADIKPLIEKLRNDDITAFDAIFNLYSSKLYHFALGYLKSREDTEELIQDVFARIWEKRGEINPLYDFQSFLFTIAYNEIKKHFRSKGMLRKYMEYAEQLPEHVSVSSSDVSYRELAKLVDQLVADMPEKRRMVFIKSRLEGKNTKQIAAEMQISPKTAENHLHAALKFLKQELSNEYLLGLLFFYIHFF